MPQARLLRAKPHLHAPTHLHVRACTIRCDPHFVPPHVAHPHFAQVNVTTLGPMVLPLSEQLIFIANLVMRKVRRACGVWRRSEAAAAGAQPSGARTLLYVWPSPTPRMCGRPLHLACVAVPYTSHVWPSPTPRMCGRSLHLACVAVPYIWHVWTPHTSCICGRPLHLACVDVLYLSRVWPSPTPRTLHFVKRCVCGSTHGQPVPCVFAAAQEMLCESAVVVWLRACVRPQRSHATHAPHLQVFGRKMKPYIPDFKTAFEHVCIHTGGRAVIDEIERQLRLGDEIAEPSRATLYRYGNISSSSIWCAQSTTGASGLPGRGQRRGGGGLSRPGGCCSGNAGPWLACPHEPRMACLSA
eukprot:365937-Chlamydomonas_euryale.AAC.4